LAPEALSLSNVHAFYGDSHILHGVGFSLRAGGVLALLGRNGAGKTTCISTIVGFLKPRAGEIRLFGEPIEGLSPERISRLGIGLVPQGRRIFSSLTVRENLIVAQQREGSTEKPWNVERIYELFPKLRERHAQFSGTLSGGEQQMLAIGRALMTNPRLLILDEATEGLAPLIRAEIWRRIEALKHQGYSILIIDKNIQALIKLASRHFIIEKGRTVWSGTSQELAAAPDVVRRYCGI
jgi:branched-chain amino acid transport system ATP-binding protein